MVNVSALIARPAYIHVPDIMKEPLERVYKQLEAIFRITTVVKEDGSDQLPPDITTAKDTLGNYSESNTCKLEKS